MSTEWTPTELLKFADSMSNHPRWAPEERGFQWAAERIEALEAKCRRYEEALNRIADRGCNSAMPGLNCRARFKAAEESHGTYIISICGPCFAATALKEGDEK